MSDSQPTIETNNENLDRPWAWLIRAHVEVRGSDGVPYDRLARLSVSLPNADAYENRPIVLHGFVAYDEDDGEVLPAQHLTAAEARAIGKALLRAADHEESGKQPARTCPNCEWAESDGTHLPDGPVMATWWGDMEAQMGPTVEVLFYCPALPGGSSSWFDSAGSSWSREQLEAEIADDRLRVKPLPPGLAEPAQLVGGAP